MSDIIFKKSLLRRAVRHSHGAWSCDLPADTIQLLLSTGSWGEKIYPHTVLPRGGTRVSVTSVAYTFLKHKLNKELIQDEYRDLYK